ncbi:MAG: DUF928 domain-containing protein [Cyanobacteria bacterium J06634_6]
MDTKCLFSVASAVGLSISMLMSGQASASPFPWRVAQNSNALLAQQSSGARTIGFVPPADEGAPRYTRGGATRDDCNALQVLPESVSGWTGEARPMVVAYFKKDVQQVLLKVEAVDGSESYIYADDELFAIEGEGLAEIPMPNSLGELTENKLYVWSMVLLCKDKPLGPNSIVVKGGVKRVAPVLNAVDAEAMSWDEKAAAYAETGLWYDLVSTLVSTKAAFPDDAEVEQAWESVWTSVGLDEAFEQFTSEE